VQARPDPQSRRRAVQPHAEEAIPQVVFWRPRPRGVGPALGRPGAGAHRHRAPQTAQDAPDDEPAALGDEHQAGGLRLVEAVDQDRARLPARAGGGAPGAQRQAEDSPQPREQTGPGRQRRPDQQRQGSDEQVDDRQRRPDDDADDGGDDIEEDVLQRGRILPLHLAAPAYRSNSPLRKPRGRAASGKKRSTSGNQARPRSPSSNSRATRG